MTKPKTIITISYIFIGLLIVPAYLYGRSIMIWFDSYVMVTKTNMTLNFLLLFFFYGVLCDRLTKKMSKRKGWVIWGIGLVILMLFFRFAGGYETIFG